jgi:hypothetical protein
VEDVEDEQVEPADLRDLFGQMRRDGRTTSEIKKTRAALSVMFATALEDGVVQANRSSASASRRRARMRRRPKTRSRR